MAALAIFIAACLGIIGAVLWVQAQLWKIEANSNNLTISWRERLYNPDWKSIKDKRASLNYGHVKYTYIVCPILAMITVCLIIVAAVLNGAS